uniref:RRM domain-containing protein n=1 Tax=Ditylenchus dipsaci TaxID=166011 RepID=A0A915CML5_9BILA
MIGLTEAEVIGEVEPSPAISRLHPLSDRRRRTRSPRGQGERKTQEWFPTHPKDDHVLIASRTLWFGKIPSNCSETDIREAVKDAGQPEKINIVAPRGCAYVTMRERRAAFKIIDRLGKDLQIQKKTVKISWAPSQA